MVSSDDVPPDLGSPHDEGMGEGGGVQAGFTPTVSEQHWLHYLVWTEVKQELQGNLEENTWLRWRHWV